MAARPHLHALTGLRFFAALYVVVFHLWRFDAWDAPALVERFVAAGPVAVTLFFVLSRFVLTYTYAEGSGLSATTGAFWRARFARVYPVYAFALLLSAPVVLVLWARSGAGAEGLTRELWHGLATAGLVQAWHPMSALAWNPPAWSLSVEAFFYLLFPFVAPRLLACKRRTAIVIAALAWTFSVGLSLAYLALDPDGIGAVDHQSKAFFLDALKYHPLARLPELIIGIVAARWLLEARGRSVVSGWAALLAVSSCAVILLSGQVSYALWHNGLLAPCFAVLFVWLACSSSSWPARVLAHPSLARLGAASYGLYILHVPLLYWIAGIGERRTGEKVLERPAVALASLALMILASLLVFRFLESPLRRALRPSRRPVHEPETASVTR